MGGRSLPGAGLVPNQGVSPAWLQRESASQADPLNERRMPELQPPGAEHLALPQPAGDVRPPFKGAAARLSGNAPGGSYRRQFWLRQ